MAERFLCNVGANTTPINYVETLRYKLKINTGEVRQRFVILAKLNSAKWCFRLDDRIKILTAQKWSWNR